VLLGQGRREKVFCLQFLQYGNITMLLIHGLTALLLVQFRGDIAVLPAFTAVLLHESALDINTECSVVSTG
jgi:hypothetical protein